MKRYLRILGLVAVLAFAASPPARAGLWCNFADKFEGHCELCNSMCSLEILMEIGWGEEYQP